MSSRPVEREQTNSETADLNENGLNVTSIAITAGFILTGMVTVGLFNEEIKEFGVGLMSRYGQGWVDIILFLLTAISSTPLALPIWGYAQAGVAIGYDVVRLASIMAVGSALGSLVTYAVGRYFSNSATVKKKFPKLMRHAWTEGRSRTYVTLFLFLGTAGPIPSDVLYAACGFKRYPVALFLVTMIVARFVRYLYLGYGFKYMIGWFD
ncbi:MAG: DedA family protein [candidate division Zixibacteria bacterium]|nr:DedA family protein [candidate division Zixibacteria bacterium]